MYIHLYMYTNLLQVRKKRESIRLSILRNTLCRTYTLLLYTSLFFANITTPFWHFILFYISCYPFLTFFASLFLYILCIKFFTFHTCLCSHIWQKYTVQQVLQCQYHCQEDFKRFFEKNCITGQVLLQEHENFSKQHLLRVFEEYSCTRFSSRKFRVLSEGPDLWSVAVPWQFVERLIAIRKFDGILQGKHCLE